MFFILFFSSFVFSQQEQASYIYVSPHTIISGINNIHSVSNKDVKEEDKIKEQINIYVNLKTVFYSVDSLQYNVVYLEEKNNPIIISKKDNLRSKDKKQANQEVVSTKVKTEPTSSPLPELPYKNKQVIGIGLTSSVVSSSYSSTDKKSKENLCIRADLFTLESANILESKVKVFYCHKSIRAFTLAIRHNNRPPPVLV